MKNPKKKRLTAALIVGIIVCLSICADKLYSFYRQHMPLAQPGECLGISDPKIGEFKIKIIKNNNLDAVTEGEVYLQVLPGMFLRTNIRVKASYEELREMNAQKVSCE